MLLKTITQHLKQQNWTGLFLELVILILGVFLGIQASNYNDSLKEREQSVIYTQKLLDNLKSEYPFLLNTKQYYLDVRASGIAAYEILLNESESDNNDLLINAFRATQYALYTPRRSVFEEITSSGFLHRIQDPLIRDVSTNFHNTRIFVILQEEGEKSEYRKLFRELAEPGIHEELQSKCGDRLIRDESGSTGIATIGYECDIELTDIQVNSMVATLRASPEFLKALRLRIAQLAGRINDIEFRIESMEIEELRDRHFINLDNSIKGKH